MEDPRMFCNQCDMLFAKEASNDGYFPVYATQDLTTCPQCKSPLRPADHIDYTWANKKAAHDQKEKGKDVMIRRLTRQIEELTRERDYYRLELDRAKATIAVLQQQLDQAKQLNLSEVSGKRPCKQCGKEFIPNHKRQRFCSDQCRLKSWEAMPGKKQEKRKEIRQRKSLGNVGNPSETKEP